MYFLECIAIATKATVAMDYCILSVVSAKVVAKIWRESSVAEYTLSRLHYFV